MAASRATAPMNATASTPPDPDFLPLGIGNASPFAAIFAQIQGWAHITGKHPASEALRLSLAFGGECILAYELGSLERKHPWRRIHGCPARFQPAFHGLRQTGQGNPSPADSMLCRGSVQG
jgi:hypothetical protein